MSIQRTKTFFSLALIVLCCNAEAQLSVNGGEFTILNGTTVSVQGDVESNVDILGNGKLLLNGSATQQLNMNNNRVYPNLEINNSSNSALTGNARIASLLTLTNGKLLVGNNNLVIESIADISNADNSRYIVTNGSGSLARLIAGSGSFDYPIGSLTEYNPANFNWVATPGVDSLALRYSNVTAEGGILLAPPVSVDKGTVTELLDNGSWFAAARGTLSSNPEFSFTRNGHTNAAANLDQHAILRRPNSTSEWALAGVWTTPPATPITPPLTGEVSLTQTVLDEFGEFDIAKSSIALPVTFTKISAVRINEQKVAVNWKVQNESNITGYQLERSNDGVNFGRITQKSKNTVSNEDYAYDDQSANASAQFYRVKAISLNGAGVYSAIAKVGKLPAYNNISVYPNPIKGNSIQVYFNEHKSVERYTVQLLNSLGQTILTDRWVIAAGNQQKSISLPRTLAAGIYQIKLTNEAGEGKVIRVSVQ